mgnify:CR=1 FL=1
MGYNWAKYKDINLHICMYNEGKIATQNKKKRSYLNPYPLNYALHFCRAFLSVNLS